MRIGIDGRPLQTVSRYRGIGSYTGSLIRSLLSLDHENRYVVFSFRGKGFPRIDGGNVEVAPVLRDLGVDRRWIWEFLFLNRVLSRYELDIFHATQPCCMSGSPSCPTVVTVHDVIPLAMGGGYFKCYRYDRRLAYRRQLGTICGAARIITYSTATKRDIVRLLNIPEDRLIVSPLGCDPRFRPLPDGGRVEECRSRYGVGGEYILFVGTAEKRKNLFRLLRVLADVRARCGDIRLVITSRQSRDDEGKIRSASRKLRIEGAVHQLGHVPLEDLVALMNGAKILVLPSFYEGFGLPVLESMACGTPVLTSNVSSLPEVAGDAALLVDPSSDEEIGEGIVRLLTDEELRKQLRRRGLERAGLFSWKRHAEDVLGVYRAVMGGDVEK